MSKHRIVQLPSLKRQFAKVAENIQMARLRRRFSASMIAERAGISRNTLRAIERGDPHVAFGAYASVLFCLGLEKDLALLARDDELGRKLQDAKLIVGTRAPRSKTFKVFNKEKHE